MKKVLFTILTIIFITGCGSKKENVMSCSRVINQSEVSVDLSYNVSYIGSYVSRVASVEKITTNDIDSLNAYMEQIKSVFEPYKNIEYYTYNVSIDGNTLTSVTDIDYSKIDTDKLLDVDSANGQIIKNGKIKIDTIKSYYESLGISCEK